MTAKQTEAGTWHVTLDVKARKVVVDSAGVETEVPMDDLVEVGVFPAAKAGGPGGPPVAWADDTIAHLAGFEQRLSRKRDLYRTHSRSNWVLRRLQAERGNVQVKEVGVEAGILPL